MPKNATSPPMLAPPAQPFAQTPRASTPAAVPAEFQQTLRASLPHFFDRDGVFLRDKFDAALHAAGITESSATPPVLTRRQREILELLRNGHGYKDIAYALGISHRTVCTTLSASRKILGVTLVPLRRRKK